MLLLRHKDLESEGQPFVEIDKSTLQVKDTKFKALEDPCPLNWSTRRREDDLTVRVMAATPLCSDCLSLSNWILTEHSFGLTLPHVADYLDTL